MRIYMLAIAVLIIVAGVMLFTGRPIWSVPMLGAALALWFIDQSKRGGDGHA